MIVIHLCWHLEQNGIRCFIVCGNIPVGTVWSNTTREAIESCEMVLVVYSGNFNQSNLVDREIECCANLKKTAFIFRLSQIPCNRVKQYYLQNIDGVDAFPFPERHFDHLGYSIGQLIRKTSFVYLPKEISVIPGET